MPAFDPRLRGFNARTTFFETVFSATAAEGRALAQAGSWRASKLIARSTTAVLESRKAIRESRSLLGNVTTKRR
jgi:hypothetical protein